MTRSRALVLGGTGHVGQAVVRGLGHAGVPTALTYYRSQDRARALQDELTVSTFALDLADVDAVRACMARVCREFGAPDILVSCATHADASGFFDIDDELFTRVMNINVRGVFVACRELAQRMIEPSTGHTGPDTATPGGDIVLVAGPDAVGATPSAAHFAASQSALTGLMRAAAAELGPRGVRVNLVAVGVLDGGAGRLLSDQRKADAERYAALGRIGTADEAARAIVWMALENPYLNGAIVPVTGGL